jgi:hypothetical protein
MAEGFACYALFPDQYVDAARQIAAPADGRPVVCVGIRSSGAVLAAVCAATLRRHGVTADTRTVRPRGHPFDRHLQSGPRLDRFVIQQAHTHFVIVDEGPGISGSSFAAVADFLERRGIESNRITLVPSWRCDPASLRSPRARDLFARCQVVVGCPADTARAAAALASDVAIDLSAGQWRSHTIPEQMRWPAVQPQHERVKYLSAGARATPALARFAGLGRHGRNKLARAHALHEAGFGPRPIEYSSGFIVREWIAGRPAAAIDFSGTALHRVADYLAFVATTFRLTDVDRGDDLSAMLRQNTLEAFGPASQEAIERLIETTPAGDYARVAVDGRLLPHEWIVTPDESGRFIKIDALDHHADDFLPGCRDVAWDVAGACEELALSDAACSLVVTRYASLTGDREIGRRLPFFRAAYLAYRLGYTTMAAAAMSGTPDGDRFRKCQERYRRSLAVRAGLPLPAAAR